MTRGCSAWREDTLHSRKSQTGDRAVYREYRNEQASTATDSDWILEKKKSLILRIQKHGISCSSNVGDPTFAILKTKLYYCLLRNVADSGGTAFWHRNELHNLLEPLPTI